MQSALWISKTGLTAQDMKMSSIANNLANVNTNAYKKSRIQFNDSFYQIQRQPGATVDEVNELPSGLQLGTGTKVVSSQKVFTTGELKTTNQQLDVAIQGNGFFQVELSNGDNGYSRDGQFYRDSDGLIVTSQGLPLTPQIKVPESATNINISKSGIVTAKISGQTEPMQLGNITLVNFANPAGLESAGDNLYLETASSGVPNESTPGENGVGQLQQGALEAANVNVVEEMVEMISTQRAYEMNAKVVSSSDNMLKFLNQQVG